ncbi:MAG TPA: NADH-quinone oxidoreductase subunit A [Thermomicrobiales bacterium]|nr:NADH-quinone oxidoreductase subunit A [Thermomicrobiales bacterium]HQZ90661.1 NADH-quinone oxidoreductase subunit A [Thermomicrobiales bacterium]HRA31632.1 NADH-quinone oxidoreductase subunit A [Thermomicrobiales bacterium]
MTVLTNYAVIGLLLLTAAAMGIALLMVGRLIRPHRPNPAKELPYESGVPGVSPPRMRYTPRFYVVAMLFVVFDIEAIFLFPWAVAFDALGLFGYIQAIVFISLLLAGLAYEWKKGALEWV